MHFTVQYSIIKTSIDNLVTAYLVHYVTEINTYYKSKQWRAFWSTQRYTLNVVLHQPSTVCSTVRVLLYVTETRTGKNVSGTSLIDSQSQCYWSSILVKYGFCSLATIFNIFVRESLWYFSN